jgi:hypothetical protein
MKEEALCIPKKHLAELMNSPIPKERGAGIAVSISLIVSKSEFRF